LSREEVDDYLAALEEPKRSTLEGTPKFAVGSETLLAKAGQVLLIRAAVAHKFINPGPGILRQVDIHLNSEFVTEWLED